MSDVATGADIRRAFFAGYKKCQDNSGRPFPTWAAAEDAFREWKLSEPARRDGLTARTKK